MLIWGSDPHWVPREPVLGMVRDRSHVILLTPECRLRRYRRVCVICRRPFETSCEVTMHCGRQCSSRSRSIAQR